MKPTTRQALADAFFHQRLSTLKWKPPDPQTLEPVTRGYIEMIERALHQLRQEGYEDALLEMADQSYRRIHLFRVRGLPKHLPNEEPAYYLIQDAQGASHVWGDHNWNDLDNDVIGWMIGLLAAKWDLQHP